MGECPSWTLAMQYLSRHSAFFASSELNIKNNPDEMFLPKLNIGIGTTYRIPRTGLTYDNKWMLRNTTVMHTAPSKRNFNQKPFVGKKMSAFSQTSVSFLGVRAQKGGLEINMDRLVMTTDGNNYWVLRCHYSNTPSAPKAQGFLTFNPFKGAHPTSVLSQTSPFSQ